MRERGVERRKPAAGSAYSRKIHTTSRLTLKSAEPSLILRRVIDSPCRASTKLSRPSIASSSSRGSIASSFARAALSFIKSGGSSRSWPSASSNRPWSSTVYRSPRHIAWLTTSTSASSSSEAATVMRSKSERSSNCVCSHALWLNCAG
eukprot:scaffold61183_cov62-Phaeocystis_antarctica.AAC.6